MRLFCTYEHEQTSIQPIIYPNETDEKEDRIRGPSLQVQLQYPRLSTLQFGLLLQTFIIVLHPRRYMAERIG